MQQLKSYFSARLDQHISSSSFHVDGLQDGQAGGDYGGTAEMVSRQCGVISFGVRCQTQCIDRSRGARQTQNGPWASEPSSPRDWGTRTSWPGAPLGESPSLGQSCPIGSGQALASYVSTDGSLKCGFARRNL